MGLSGFLKYDCNGIDAIRGWKSMGRGLFKSGIIWLVELNTPYVRHTVYNERKWSILGANFSNNKCEGGC